MPIEEKKYTGTDMTEGPIAKQLIYFTIPLMLGNLFQQLYNTTDTIIVGRFVGPDALAAVGSSASLINLLISLLMGISAGAGVVVARYFGAKQYEDMRRTINTTICFGLVAGAIMSVVGVLVTPALLRWMGTPESVMDSSVLYFRVYFSGVLTTVMYNFGSGIFRALGDSKRPLYFLIFSAGANVVMTLLFVAILDWGIAGAALATVIAQGMSVVLVYSRLFKSGTIYQVKLQELRFHMEYLKQIISIGLPSGLQNALVSFSNVVVQSNINSFGEIAMAGCASYSKVEGFALMSSGSFGLAMSTFVSQNIGANRLDRAKKGAKVGLLSTILVTEVVGVLLYILAPFLVSLFNSDPDIIYYGVLQARTVSLFYLLVGCTHGMSGILRGAGLSKVPMISMLVCWCLMRVLWIETMVPLTGNIRMVFWAYPITWTMSTVFMGIYLLKSDWLNKGRLQVQKSKQ